MAEGKLKFAVRPETLLVMMAAACAGFVILCISTSKAHRGSDAPARSLKLTHASQFAYGRGMAPGVPYMNNGMASGNDYLADIIAGGDGPHRWSKAKFPLKVFIGNGASVPGYQPYMRQLMAQAFQDWQDQTQGLVSWQQVNSPMQADIVTLWTADVQARQGGVEAGNTESLTAVNGYSGDGDIQAAKITILTGMGGRPFSQAELRKTTLHEVGHAFGLEGHSHIQTDIMYPAVNAAQTPYLRTRDVNTMLALYNGAGNANPYGGIANGGYGRSPYSPASYGYGSPAPQMASMPRGSGLRAVAGQLAQQWLQQHMGGAGYAVGY